MLNFVTFVINDYDADSVSRRLRCILHHNWAFQFGLENYDADF